MARLIYSERALADLERIVDYLLEREPDLVAPVIGLIEEAVMILVHHPHIGREVEEGLRELVISHGATGYLALYEYEPTSNRVLIYAIRHQREAGYPDAQ